MAQKTRSIQGGGVITTLRPVTFQLLEFQPLTWPCLPEQIAAARGFSRGSGPTDSAKPVLADVAGQIADRGWEIVNHFVQQRFDALPARITDRPSFLLQRHPGPDGNVQVVHQLFRIQDRLDCQNDLAPASVWYLFSFHSFSGQNVAVLNPACSASFAACALWSPALQVNTSVVSLGMSLNFGSS